MAVHPLAGPERILPLTEPMASLPDYLAGGGGAGLAAATRNGPEWVISELAAAGLRGRGGTGSPTAAKWTAVRRTAAATYAVANAAEGEPGTFKDRFILRRNPYQVLEGLAIAALAVGASRALLVIKRRFEPEIIRLLAALEQMHAAGLLGQVPVQLVFGPDQYLLGEEQAAAAVIGCAAPLPRSFPPYRIGPVARRGAPSPTAMNNVETLAHVPEILRLGADWFRSAGTQRSPGRTVFTISGDVRRPGVHELELGLPLRMLIDLVAGGVPNGRRVKVVVPGTSAAVLTAGQLDTALDFDSLHAAGSGLGSAGFVVYDDSACIVAATLVFAHFLAIESCAQCPACKPGIVVITECLRRIERGEGTGADLDTIGSRCAAVTGGQRCALPSGAAALVRSSVAGFAGEFAAHLGRTCPLPRELAVPKFVDFDEAAGRFSYDERYRLKQPDWSFADESDDPAARERSA